MSFSSSSALDKCIGVDRNTIVLIGDIPFNISADDWRIMLDRVVCAGTLNQIRLSKEPEFGIRVANYDVVTYFTVENYICEKDMYSISIQLTLMSNDIKEMIIEKVKNNEYELSPYVMNMRNTDDPNKVICKLINYFILYLS